MDKTTLSLFREFRLTQALMPTCSPKPEEQGNLNILTVLGVSVRKPLWPEEENLGSQVFYTKSQAVTEYPWRLMA